MIEGELKFLKIQRLRRWSISRLRWSLHIPPERGWHHDKMWSFGRAITLHLHQHWYFWSCDALCWRWRLEGLAAPPVPPGPFYCSEAAPSSETGRFADAEEGADGLFALDSGGGGSGEGKSHGRATRAAGISHVAAQTTPLPLSYHHALRLHADEHVWMVRS